MQLVCVTEITAEHEIKLDEKIKFKLHPGEKVRLKIESIKEEKEQNRLKAVEQLRKISMNSRLGLHKTVIERADAHQRDIHSSL